MSKKILYAHAGSGNHGCEAIVRTSAEILGDNITLYSMNLTQDEKYGLHRIVDRIISDKDLEIKKYSIQWFFSRIQTKLTGSITQEMYNRKKTMFDNVQKGDIAISIGGDNYCYPGTEILGAENTLFRRKGAKTVLWGCSVEPEILEKDDVKKDIAKYDLIVARESISYEALKKVNSNTVLIPDPAFVLKSIECPLPSEWIENKMIGINVSPLIMQASKNGEMILESYIELIKYIIGNTEYSIALIPHVVWKNNDDRIPLKKLYDMFDYTGRVVIVDDHNCMELKGFIQRCRMFIGARTHATIAAYSSCVPTLVMGYSVKSRGIARDLFETEDKYVLPVQDLKDKQELKNAFIWLMEHEKEIRDRLIETMPKYLESYSIFAEVFEKLKKEK